MKKGGETIPRSKSQKLSMVRQRVSFIAWRNTLDLLKEFKEGKISEADVMVTLFENMDSRRMFRYETNAYYELQSIELLLDDNQIEKGEPPEGWSWKLKDLDVAEDTN